MQAGCPRLGQVDPFVTLSTAFLVACVTFRIGFSGGKANLETLPFSPKVQAGFKTGV
jgi:hypothetical protein